MTVIGPSNLGTSDLGPLTVNSPDVLSSIPGDRSDVAFIRHVVAEALYSSVPPGLYTDPHPSHVDPPSGIAGAQVTVWGYGFSGATAVTFDGVPATAVTPMSNRDVQCVVPAGTVGPADVVVTTPQGNGTLVGGFTYTALAGELTASEQSESPAPESPAQAPDSRLSAEGAVAPAPTEPAPAPPKPEPDPKPIPPPPPAGGVTGGRSRKR